MEKHYVAGRIEEVEALALMENVGLTDAVDQARLIAALDAIREYGAALPSEPRGNGASASEVAGTDKATDAQLALIPALLAYNDAGECVHAVFGADIQPFVEWVESLGEIEPLHFKLVDS
jgi:hypothetical protein